MAFRISLIMPTLNERVGLEYIAKDLPTHLFHEIIVIDGGSTDQTVEYAKSLGFQVRRQSGSEGMIRAEIDGYQMSTGDAIIVFTPDGNSLCSTLPALCAKLEEGFDFVIMSRYKPPAVSDDDHWVTSLGNQLFIVMVNLLNGTSYTDVTVAYRGYSRKAVDDGLIDFPRQDTAQQKIKAR